MKAKVKSALQYPIILLVMGILLWFSISNIKTNDGLSRWDFIVKVWETVDKKLLILSGLAAVVSHIIRAERWKLSFQPMDIKIKLGDSFMSVMVGYFVNLVIPRGGELSRCINLNKLENVAIDKSFGTVLAERAIDLIFLILFVLTGFLLEFNKLTQFFSELKYQTPSGFKNIIIISFILILVLIVGIGYLRISLKNKSRSALKRYVKLRSILLGIKQGVLVIFHLKRKFLFLFYSIIIWLLYLMMSVLILKAFPETNQLGLVASLAIFAIGSIAMALPLPGGTGSYHVLVPAGLVALYQIPISKATVFTIIFHGWQTLIIVVFGTLSLLFSYISYRRRKRKLGDSIMTK